jgi:hypothetical protein
MTISDQFRGSIYRLKERPARLKREGKRVRER